MRTFTLRRNTSTWMGEAGERLADVVREARKVDLEIIMVHEVDEARGGCEFAHFFQSTPQDLIEDGLYRNIAIAAHPPPHRAVTVALVGQACGARARHHG